MNAPRFDDDAPGARPDRGDAEIKSIGPEPPSHPGRRSDPQAENLAEPGLVARFDPGAVQRIDAALAELSAIGSMRLKWALDPADWLDPVFRAWVADALPRLAERADLVMSFRPAPAPAVVSASDPWRPESAKTALVGAIRAITDGHAPQIGAIELEVNPLRPGDWDWRWDSDARVFTSLVTEAASLVSLAGLPFVLGGIAPHDVRWLRAVAADGGLKRVTAIGLSAPLREPAPPEGSPRARDRVAALRELHPAAEIWITTTPDWLAENHEGEPLVGLVDWLDSGAARIYLGAGEKSGPTLNGVPTGAPRSALIRSDGSPGLFTREVARGGVGGFRQFICAVGRSGAAAPNGDGSPQHQNRGADDRLALVTGGAGFIGANVAARLLSEGCRVRILDNLSRPGVENNLRRLISEYGDRVEVRLADIREGREVARAVEGVDQIYHFAAQVAVTTSVTHPMADFGVNVRGAMHLLEAIRHSPLRPGLLFTSTNKVYGQLEDVELEEAPTRYQPINPELRERGVDESRPLDFHSPYGCSKGAADQYVLDYARTYGVRACVFRMSCIYGALQHGTEDQGWVAHFLLKAMRGEPITIYGDGKQVRDILYVSDLVHAMLLAQRRIDALAGRVFNIGGGPANTVSLLELMGLIQRSLGVTPKLVFGPWRTGDQKYYVSDTSAFRAATGWSPRLDVISGVEKLRLWLAERNDAAPSSASPEPPPKLAPEPAPKSVGQGKIVHALSQ